MRKIFLLLLLFPLSLLSQSTPKVCTIYQIDSLADVYGNSLFDSAGRLTIHKSTLFGKKIVADGGFTNSMYYSTPSNYKSFSSEEKKLRVNAPKLIKAVYSESLSFKDGRDSELTGEFYYCNEILFSVKLSKKTVSREGRSDEATYIIEINADLSEAVENAFSFNVSTWIHEKNEEFLKLSL